MGVSKDWLYVMDDSTPLGGTPDGTSEVVAARGGRPRDPAVDTAIILATRRRLVTDGYSNMTMGNIAKDAGVTRPTLYRRWPGKLDLVIDALDYGFKAQRQSYPVEPWEGLSAVDALTEAVRRLDQTYFNPDAIVLMGNFIGEAYRTPELLAVVRKHALEPRVSLIKEVIEALKERGEVRLDVDTHAVATLCYGSYLGAYLLGGFADREDVANRVVAALWPSIKAAD
jgi:AcrR family transcriptional regulator